MFELITQVIDLYSLRSLSSIYSYECISVKSDDIGRDVWIQYYKNEEMGASVFSVGDSINMLGGVPTIMLYVENDNDKSSDKTYSVYRYNGILQIDRRIVGNLRHDILVNIEDIITELKSYLNIFTCNVCKSEKMEGEPEYSFPDEFINFAGLAKEDTGLAVDIFLDQCNSYKEFDHPFWLYYRNSYGDLNDFIPITIDDKKVLLENKKLNIYQKDIIDIIRFIVAHFDDIHNITEEKMDVFDLYKKIKAERTEQK